MDDFRQTPGEKIKYARMRRGLTQQELADALNEVLDGSEIIERSMISRWEKDKNFPRNSRRDSLEKILGVDLGAPPTRRETFSTYMTSRSEIEKALLLALQNCNELWMTTLPDERIIWNELPKVNELFASLRKDEHCLVKELYYIRTLEDLAHVKRIIDQNNPCHSIHVRTSPGHPFPVLLAPNNRYGVMLSGFFDDITSVGLELSGQVAGFNEHYFRHIWNKGSALYENQVFFGDNYAQAEEVLKNFGGKVTNEFVDKR